MESLKMARAAMPQFYRREIATGELAQVTVTLGDAVSRTSPYEEFIGKLPKTVSLCHLSSAATAGATRD
jgi:hypothetical protein